MQIVTDNLHEMSIQFLSPKKDEITICYLLVSGLVMQKLKQLISLPGTIW